ncbi:MAG TPA: HDOD domain-containing protein [Caldimonas sp.]|jgi:hypothetical protein|nr:HDOD domain-containing protein [Caldimonas sp.]HEX2539628.1 HDOD domain-containing protein [Caldimonas sp.]
MPSTRWWNPVSRWLRPPRQEAHSGTAAPTLQPAFVPAEAAIAPVHAAFQDTVGRLADAPGAPAISPELLRLGIVEWMIGVAPVEARRAAAPAAVVTDALFERLDEVTASEALRSALLPRAPHVIPQLMKTLRDDGYSSADVAAKISRDAVLTAEVIRSATSAFRRGDNDSEEIDLAWAVAAIGTQGLRRAIASVVLRPIFDARGDTLSSRAATQIWKDADRKAKLCSALAAQGGLDPFDGYLAGLLHNTGWTALLRAIDGFRDIPIEALGLAHAEVVPRLLRRRDALFGALVEPWKLSPAVDRVAAEIGHGGIDAAGSPLGQALREAERLAALHALAPAGQRPSATVPGWATLPKPVQDCYRALGRT